MAKKKNQDLHGNAPDKSVVALLIIDMINDLEWPGAEDFLEPAVEAARHIAELKARAAEAGIPVVYCNDNFGRWRSDFNEVIDHVLNDGTRGQPLAELLLPSDEDYFVLKPKHSAFFETTLDTLLSYLQAERLILTGITGDICVLLSASDAYIRDFEIVVPPECTASVSADENDHAVRYMERVLKARLLPAGEVDFEALSVPVARS